MDSRYKNLRQVARSSSRAERLHFLHPGNATYRTDVAPCSFFEDLAGQTDILAATRAFHPAVNRPTELAEGRGLITALSHPTCGTPA